MYVKPNNPRFTSILQEGKVTRQLYPTTDEVNGRPHHISDVRRVNGRTVKYGVDTT